MGKHLPRITDFDRIFLFILKQLKKREASKTGLNIAPYGDRWQLTFADITHAF